MTIAEYWSRNARQNSAGYMTAVLTDGLWIERNASGDGFMLADFGETQPVAATDDAYAIRAEWILAVGGA